MPEIPQTHRWAAGRTRRVRAAAVMLRPGEVIRPGLLAVTDGRLVSVTEPSGPLSPNDDGITDLGDVFLAGGLTDAHVHLALDPGDGSGPEARAARAADFGLAMVRDGGDRLCRVLTDRGALENHLGLAASGTALFRPGRYGGFLGRPVADREQVQMAVRELAGAGADQIKVLASGPVSIARAGVAGPPQFTPAELRLIVALAADHGLPVMAHANGPEAVDACVMAGVSSIEHGYFMGLRAMERLAAAGCDWVPTLTPLDVMADAEPDPGRADRIRAIVRSQEEAVARAMEMGIAVRAGTDAGAPGVHVGPSLYRELALFVRAGMSRLQALSSALPRDLAEGGSARVIGFQLTDHGDPDLAAGPVWTARSAEGPARLHDRRSSIPIPDQGAHP